jgi:hypothetical protein
MLQVKKVLFLATVETVGSGQTPKENFRIFSPALLDAPKMPCEENKNPVLTLLYVSLPVPPGKICFQNYVRI